MTRDEAIKMLRLMKYKYLIQIGSIFDTALDIAIEALEGVCFDEWCDDCKEYDTEKKCCPRFNKVIREALKREPSENGTLEVKVDDATKIGRVLISDDEHRGGLYYPDEDETKGEDLISRAEAIEALGEEPPVWCDEEYEIAERDQWRADIEAIKSVPSADRPRGEWIPASERLPSEKKAVLICDSRGNCFVGKLVLTDYGYKWSARLFRVWIDIEDGDAWVPLPEPYKESDTK